MDTWVSHSSMSDYQKCPRAYYLKNVYRDSKTGHKISLMTPSLALGQAVHAVLEQLAILPVGERFQKPLLKSLAESWNVVHGKLGGFLDPKTEKEYYDRAVAMLEQVSQHPGPIAKQAIRIKAESNLPRYKLEDDLILCGKIDWLEYVPEDDSIRILDFKTGKHDEQEGSLQLPIYYLLVQHLQKRAITGASYWYLDHAESPEKIPLPDLTVAEAEVLRVAQDVRWARANQYYTCHRGGCFACRDYEAIIDGKAEFVGQGGYSQDIYILP